MARPLEDPFDAMTYQRFCENYEPSTDGPKAGQRLQRWKRIDGSGFIKKRETTHVILKSPAFKPDPQHADYCFSEVMLRSVWRHIDQLPSTDEDCINRFQCLRQQQSPDGQAVESVLTRQSELDRLSAEHMAPECRLPSIDWVIGLPSKSTWNVDLFYQILHI
jgi:hypothetical protein